MVSTAGDPEHDGTSGEVEDAEDLAPEKVEVHVHVHRGPRGDTRAAGPERRRRRLSLNGSLIDWQGHYERLEKEVPADPPELEPSSQVRGPRGKVAVALGLGSVIAILGVLLRLALGRSGG